MTLWADPQDVAAKVAGWTDGQIDCRMLGKHAWPSIRDRLTLRWHGRSEGRDYFLVEQTCMRRCGVTHAAYFDENWRQTTTWKPDYSKAEGYLMFDEDKKRLGRIDADGKAVIWRAATVGLTWTEIPDE